MTMERLAAALSDRYRIERELGAGGMATVYLAEDLKHRRSVAVKVLKPELAAVLGADRFVQEITTTAALQHPHILPLFDSGDADGFLFYVMPFIDGETLRSRLDRETQLGVPEAVRIATEVADALHYAHGKGVIHRDIKPENILLHDGRPMVADFGIALAVSAAAGGRMTETGLSLGTPHYMSPEQATAEREITARSDQYSLASVLYEMLTGNPPHTGASAQQIIMKIITEQPAPVTSLRRSVPGNVAAAVAQALEKLPADRFDSAKAFAEALANPAFATQSAGMAAPGRLPAALDRRGVVVMVAVAALAIATAAWGLTRPAARSGRTAVTPVWLAVDPPHGSFGDFPSPVLSPDGRRIAFFAPDAAGVRQLWVRALDSPVARPVAGTAADEADLSQQPFWSPDGQSLGYFADRALYRVDLDGRAPLRLADAPNPRGGSWGSNGVIIFVPTSGGVYRLPASGGAAMPITDTTAPPGAVDRWPFFLPDGRHFLFYRRMPGTAPTVHVGTLDGSDVRLVLQVSSRAEYDDGYLYFRRDGALFAQPFDARRLALKGTATRVVDEVGVSGADYRNGAFSAAAGNLVTWNGIHARLSRLTVYDAGGRPLRTIGQAGYHLDFAVEPGEGRVAIERVDAKTALPGIWTIDVASGLTSLVAAPSEGGGSPRWIPGGRGLLYSTLTAGTLARHSLTTAEVEEIPSLPAWITSVTPDGKNALVAAPVAGTGSDIMIVPLDGGGRRSVYLATADNERSAAISPDGAWVAYSSDESGRPEIYVQAFPVPGNKQRVSDDGGNQPVWSADGSVLYYLDRDNVLIGASVTRNGSGPAFSRRPLFRAPPLQAATTGRGTFAALGDGTFVFNVLTDSVTVRTMRVGLNWAAR
jgi:eukaryotic-like serine/threonine-protein kinase